MLEVFFGISLVLNALLVWYVIKLLKKVLSFSDALDNLFSLLEEYSKHVDAVYNLERFYGDTTLENLLKHAQNVSEEIKYFRSSYFLDYEDDVQDEDYLEEEDV